jgi:formylglycine-generating enzyme required for sulfatase activity
MMKLQYLVLSLSLLLVGSCYKYDNPLDPENWQNVVPEMVLVQGGTFSNGTSNVTVSSFHIAKYQLTQGEYASVMGTNPSNFTSVTNGPVEQVSWFNAIEYCNRRSMQEALTPCYSYLTYGTNPDNWPAGWNTNSTNHTNVSCNWTANGYRLPTEMEWMFAAKGGNQSQGYTYSGSNDINAVAWYSGNSGSTTHNVGTKAANELGIYDMSGNVYEWVWDIYGSYPSGPQTDPHGATSGSSRVLRGGSWYNSAGNCTVSYRTDSNMAYGNRYVGFRVSRVSP